MIQNDDGFDWETILVGEKLIFTLLGKILYTELDKTWLQSLIDDDIFAESPFGESQTEIAQGLAYLQEWCQENRSGISAQAFLDLQADYMRLFVGVGKVLAPIWESVYFSDERMVFQEETLQVRNWYRRFKLESEKLHQEPDDHLGLELAFVAHLAQLGLQALEQGDEAEFRQSLAAQRFFLSQHLLKWAFKWAALVNKFSKTNFYRGVSHLVSGALIEAASYVGAQSPMEIVK